MAEAGLTVATGGYAGLMEAVSAGAAAAGGHVIGITAPTLFPGRIGANEHVIEERPATGLTDRLRLLVEGSDAAVVLPGSLGTVTELLVAWNLAYLERPLSGRPRPLITVGTTWRDVVSSLSSRLAATGDLVTCVDTVEEAVGALLDALAAH